MKPETDLPGAPTASLRREHELILRVVDAFEQAVDRAERGEEGEVLEEFLDFFRHFVGRCHHGKEEGLLFPALADEGLSTSSGPLAVMMEEHRRGRELVASMARDLATAREGDPRATRRFAYAARDYADLLRAHIGKENPAVFDEADHLLAGPACRRLCEAFGSADEEDIGGRSVAELERLAERLTDDRT